MNAPSLFDFDLPLQETPMTDQPPAAGHNGPPAPIPFTPPAPRGRRAPPVPAPAGMSVKFDKIAAALGEVQASIYAPPRNKTATIVPRSKPSYEFSYTTLDIILEMLKEPLQRTKLALSTTFLTDPTGQPLLRILLLHSPSSQWLESVIRIPPNDQGVQGIGSATTYLRRYAICAMFNIASDEDTDAAEAMGNGAIMVPATQEQAQRLAGQNAGELYSRLVAAANGATTPNSALRLLTIWTNGMVQFFGFRDSEAHAEQWTAILDLTVSALTRVYGPEIGDLWRRVLVCTTREQLAALRQAHAAAKEPRERMNKTDKEAYSRFNQQMVLAAKRVETEPPPAAPAAPVTEFGSEEGRPVESEHVLFDDSGDVAGDPFTDRGRFVDAYLTLRQRSDDLNALAQHNEDTLAWAREDQAVAARLIEAVRQADAAEVAARPPAPAAEPPPLPPLVERDLYVPVPVRRSGGEDWVSYLSNVQHALAKIDPREVLPWRAANAETFARLPLNTRLKALSLLSTAAQRCGVKLG